MAGMLFTSCSVCICSHSRGFIQLSVKVPRLGPGQNHSCWAPCQQTQIQLIVYARPPRKGRPKLAHQCSLAQHKLPDLASNFPFLYKEGSQALTYHRMPSITFLFLSTWAYKNLLPYTTLWNFFPSASLDSKSVNKLNKIFEIYSVEFCFLTEP